LYGVPRAPPSFPTRRSSDLDPFDPAAPLELVDSITLLAHVSKGTYIRSLARDIAHALGTVGHVTWLRRTKAGPFTEDQAISLDTDRKSTRLNSSHVKSSYAA